MKCIVCHEPDNFVIKEIDRPQIKDNEALVRIRRIGICGTDLHAYKGRQPYFEYPRVLGHELAGEIAQIGDNEYGLEEGDRVAILPYLECGSCVACRNGMTNCCIDLDVLGVHEDGGMCEYMALPVDHLIKTDDITLDEAVVVEPFSIGAHAVRKANIKEGEFALVIGVGPIGLGVAKFASIEGARVIAMDINDERLEYCKDWADAEFTVNALKNPREELEKITGGEFPTVVFDATGNNRSMMKAFEYTAHGSRLVFVGFSKEDITFNDPDFHKKELTIMASRNANREDFLYVIDSLQKGLLDASSYITHRVSFDGMIEKYESWLKPETGVIKAVVEI